MGNKFISADANANQNQIIDINQSNNANQNQIINEYVQNDTFSIEKHILEEAAHKIKREKETAAYHYEQLIKYFTSSDKIKKLMIDETFIYNTDHHMRNKDIEFIEKYYGIILINMKSQDLGKEPYWGERNLYEVEYVFKKA
jgi:stalled ribosome rescue protein Dom34